MTKTEQRQIAEFARWNADTLGDYDRCRNIELEIWLFAVGACIGCLLIWWGVMAGNIPADVGMTFYILPLSLCVIYCLVFRHGRRLEAMLTKMYGWRVNEARQAGHAGLERRIWRAAPAPFRYGMQQMTEAET